METPERNRINAPLHPNQDSPVFNFINNLSPIKFTKPYSFSSPFPSPHLTPLHDSIFLNSYNHNHSPPDFNLNYSNQHSLPNSTQSQQNTNQGIPIEDHAIRLPQPLNYNSGSPDFASMFSIDEEIRLLELPKEAPLDVTYLQEEASKTDLVKTEIVPQGTCQIEPKTQFPDCAWDDFLPGTTDLIIFNSPNQARDFNGLFQKPFDSCTDLMSLLSPPRITNSGHNVQYHNSIASRSQHEIEDQHSHQLAATGTDHVVGNVAMNSNQNEKREDELVSVMHRGLRRRCLDFEMASVARKNSDDNSNIGSSGLLSDRRNVTNEKQLVHTNHNSDSRNCNFPGIGLHLNALAPLKDHNVIQNEKLSSGRQLNLICSTSSFKISTSQEHHHLPGLLLREREIESSNNGLQPAEDCREDLNQNSPRKKRRKSNPPGETEGCKRCNCKKSKCLKLYCECFAAGVYCIEPCSCQDCFNQAIHEDTVLQSRKQIESRNPIAFTPKVIRNSESAPEVGEYPNKTPAPARHKRGCNCKKSGCLKKYCECFQGGVGCSINCRCEGCKNAFGSKDGKFPLSMQKGSDSKRSAVLEAEPEEETEAGERGVDEKDLQKTGIQNIEDHSDSAFVSTPSLLSRSLLPLPYSSMGKPPRTFVATISGPALFGSSSQKLENPNSLWSQSKHFQTVPDDVLSIDSPPVACIKTSSPNGKRISSPNCEVGPSSSHRGVRKLILQSIPSFPSLTNQQ